jgi:chromosomal replication initiator protein
VRVAILLEKAEQNGVSLDYEFIEFIARHIKNNVRDLEGAVIRVLAKSSLLNKEIDHTLVRDVVRERTGGTLKAGVSIEKIVRKVSEISGVSEQDIVGKSRKMEIAEARQVSMFLSREILGRSLSGIGVFFGGRDHTTVMHAVKTISDKIDSNQKMKDSVNTLRSDLNQNF